MPTSFSAASKTVKPHLRPFNVQAIPQGQHKYLISKFAKLRFNSGDPERGRTLLENLLATIKKKNDDLDNMFLDMGIKCGSEEDDGKESVRTLFERAFAEQTSTRQAKALFKKWLGFEKSKGMGGVLRLWQERGRNMWRRRRGSV